MSVVEELGMVPNEIHQEYRDILGDRYIAGNVAGADGWVQCWDPGRPKGNSPSAAFNERSGWFTDLGQKGDAHQKPVDLVEMKVRYGGCLDAREAIVSLRARWRPHTLTGFTPSRQITGAGNTAPRSAQVDGADRRETSPLEFVTDKGELDPGHVGGFISAKPGTTYEGLLKVGARPCLYPKGGEDRKPCLYLKAFDSRLDFEKPQSVVLMRRDGKKFGPAAGSEEERSNIVRKGGGQKTSGMIGEHGLRLIRDGKAKIVWKVEGVTDLIALQEIIPPHLTDEVAVISSACGATENATPKEFVRRLASIPTGLVGDCDKAGQFGVSNWGERLAEVGNTNVFAIPPWRPVAPSKGEDLRDLIVAGKTYEQLLAMAVPVSAPAKEEGDDEYRIESISVRELMKQRFVTEWHIDHVAARNQNLIVGGPSKSLKTSIMLDAVAAMASGREFLNFGKCTSRTKCGIISAESGLPVLQDTIRRICEGKQIDPEDIEFEISCQLPQLTNEKHQTAVRRWIEKHQLGLVVFDPAYLMLLDESTAQGAGNVFSMGTALRKVAQIGVDTGATTALQHHTTKASARQSVFTGEPITLEDMSQSGFAEFARQWWLLSRREKYRDDGNHSMWLSYGGSAGHCGLKGLDIREGLLSDFGGRRWSVTARNRSDIEEAQEQRSDETKQAKERAKSEAAAEAVLDLARSKGPIVLRDLKSIRSVPRTAAEAAFETMTQDGTLIRTTITRGNRQTYEAWTLSHCPTVPTTVRDSPGSGGCITDPHTVQTLPSGESGTVDSGQWHCPVFEEG